MNLNRTLLLIIRSSALLLLLFSSCWSFKNFPRLRETISITKQSSANITLAYEACELWRALLEEKTSHHISAQIRCMCQVLYAACLARTGRDDQAVSEYEKALNFRGDMSQENIVEAVMGRGKALQRLLTYDEARKQFLESRTESAVCAAATCSLRLGDSREASHILRKYLLESQESSTGEAEAMLFVLDMMSQSCSKGAKVPDAAKSRLLCRWMWGIYGNQCFQTIQPHTAKNDILDLVVTNISPFDESTLIHLDDKVLLHTLLQSANATTRQFWPYGLTHGVADLERFCGEEDLWIHKRRSGYGSHGNSVLTQQQAREMAKSLNGESLLQRMVQLSLLDERKFSLRVYIVYFPSQGQAPEVYISKQGLVKVASLPAASADSVVDMRVHMTNSGRDSSMTQKDFDYLRDKFAANGWSYEILWTKIAKAVQSTMEAYHSQIVLGSEHDSNLRLAAASIPKILGFDFVVDKDQQNPWLVEINRFPGLEARDESDRRVKEKVLLDAWELASRRANLTDTERKAVFGELLETLNGDGNNCSCLVVPIEYSRT